MALRDVFKRVATSQGEHDRKKLAEALACRPGLTPIGQLEPRVQATVAGEIASLRVVPAKDGSPWLEATLRDGSGSMVVLWTGRRKIAGVRPGAKLQVSGRATPVGHTGRLTLWNPVYELLA